MKNIARRMVAIVSLCIATVGTALAGVPGPGGPPPPPAATGVPLDDGLWVLLLGGMAYGIKKFYSYKKRES